MILSHSKYLTDFGKTVESGLDPRLKTLYLDRTVTVSFMLYTWNSVFVFNTMIEIIVKPVKGQ